MIPKKIGIIGLGLIGGTLAKTIHRIYPQLELVACDSNTATVKQALLEGVITYGAQKIDQYFTGCSYLILCAPIQENQAFLSEIAGFLKDGCLLTDTGSVKTSIHEDIKHLGLSASFIGGHPMAGSEKSGYQHATAYLFENAYYILTPTTAVSATQVSQFRDFIRSLGCIPLILAADQHDFMTAAVSHLPHVLASALVNMVKALDDKEETMKAIAAGGFKDITRIASSSPIVWQEICTANQIQIVTLLDAFMQSVAQIKQEIADGCNEQVYDFFCSAKDYRDSLPIFKTGSLPAIYELYCDLIDEAGGIATIATILASNHISIKNIGIIHNREFQDGVLRIEFYGEKALCDSTALLKRHHYSLYER